MVSGGSPPGAVIRTPDQRLRVFVSSTLGELAAERRVVERAIGALRLTPVLFEVGARPHPPREVYKAYLAQSDVFIGLYWQQYGQIAPGGQVSGLEEEFELSSELPRLLYVKSPAPDREPRLADLLARIKAESAASYRHFRTTAELARSVRDDLAVLLSERFTASPAAAAAPQRVEGPRPLPASPTSLVGREQAIDEVTALVTDPQVRLVTLTGAGGVGKTRLALAVGERLRDRFGGGTAFVPLGAVADPGLALAGIARAVGADLSGAGPLPDALAEQIWADDWLVILDNMEQLADLAQDLHGLLTRCPGLRLLATSRMVLSLQAEREYPVPPLQLPPDPATAPLDEVAASPAVALFVDRARAVRHDFALTAANAAAVIRICRRLEGLPLAIELAAARIRLLDPAGLQERLCRSLDALGTGAVDAPERQQNLRATVEWSISLLEDSERSLLEIAAAFTDGWTVDAVALVAGLSEDQALELTEALARHSLVQPSGAEPEPRSRMLETVREFVAERLDGRPDAEEIRRAHAGYYRALVERAAGPLRRGGHDEWAARLEAEERNLSAAVRWHLAHDLTPLPGMFDALLPILAFNDDFIAEARSWIEQLLPTTDSLDSQASAQVLLAAAVTARELTDAAALAARDRLRSLLKTIRQPYLHAVSQVAMAISSAISGDVDSAVREAGAGLTELRGQDEPFWTAMALISLGTIDIALGQYDDALSHLRETSEVAEQCSDARLAAAARLQLGSLALARGRVNEAFELLDDALGQNLALSNTRNVSVSLAAIAQLVFAEGDPEQSALLQGAAEGVRRRAGLRTWPTMRIGQAELAEQVRQALGAQHFDELTTAGARLSQRQAAAAVHSPPGAD
jgi:predicted ATPase/predicted negative regulator of RcsB-dependent stress response